MYRIRWTRGNNTNLIFIVMFMQNNFAYERKEDG